MGSAHNNITQNSIKWKQTFIPRHLSHTFSSLFLSFCEPPSLAPSPSFFPNLLFATQFTTSFSSHCRVIQCINLSNDYFCFFLIHCTLHTYWLLSCRLFPPFISSCLLHLDKSIDNHFLLVPSFLFVMDRTCIRSKLKRNTVFCLFVCFLLLLFCFGFFFCCFFFPYAIHIFFILFLI